MLLRLSPSTPKTVFLESADVGVTTVVVSPSRLYEVWDASTRRVGQPNPPLVEHVAVDLLALLTDTDYLFKQLSKLMDEGLVRKGDADQTVPKASCDQIVDESALQGQQLRGCRPSEYLQRTLFPLLAQGLVQVERQRPEDPLAFLAAFLLESRAKGSRL